MNDYDVIISGGGPAGSTAARYCAIKGLNTLIIESLKHPRSKPCGGLVTLNSLKEYKIEHLIDAVSNSIIIRNQNGLNVKSYESRPIIAQVLREQFDNELFRMAGLEGAFTKENETVLNYELIKNIVYVTTSKNDYTSKILIAADGAQSRIAAKAGLEYNHDSMGFCYVTQKNLGTKLLDDYFTKDRTIYMNFLPFGYGWIFPKKETINIGYGGMINVMPKGKTGKQFFIEYINSCIKDKILPELGTYDIKGGFAPMKWAKKETCLDNLLLIGDAAGLVNPMSGAGIDYAMISGYLAAEACKNAIDNNNFSKSFFKKNYELKWKERIGKNMWITLLGQKIMLSGKNEYLLRLANKDKELFDTAVSLIINDIKPIKAAKIIIKRILANL